MLKISYRGLIQSVALLAGIGLIQPGSLAAQEPVSQDSTSPVHPVEIASLLPELPAAPSESARPEAAGFAFTPVVSASASAANPDRHPFWDRENKVLFALAGGMATADFFVTHRNLASGGRELDPVARVMSGSTPGLAANFALETSGLIVFDYVLHKTGHHKLERIVSVMNIGSSAGAVAFDLAHQ